MGFNKQLSVLIPVYNTEKYLRRCLDSVIDALPENSEILIINDGSPDNAEIIIYEFLKKYPTLIRYFKKENTGLADTKNYALERAEGEFVIFLDSDDYVDKQIYTKLLSAAREQNATIAMCDIQLEYDDGRPPAVSGCCNTHRETPFSQAIDVPLMAASCNMIVHKSIHDGLPFPRGMNNEDIAVTPVLYWRAKNIAFVQEPLYFYVQRAGSIQNISFGEHRSVIIDTTHLCIERLNEASTEDIEMVKGSIYAHQILAIILHPMRKLKFITRYRTLKAYLRKAETLLPDLFSNRYVLEYKNNNTFLWRIFMRTTFFLMEYRQYFLTCITMSIANLKSRSTW